MSMIKEPHTQLKILGSKVDIVQMDEVLDIMEHWIRENGPNKYIVASGMHGIMEAHKNSEFKEIMNSADLFVADGISVVWAARLRGHSLKKRVSGPTLMARFLELSNDRGYKIFFYGDTQEILDQLTTKLERLYPRLNIVGSHSPPFRSLTEEEDLEIVDIINESEADVIWIGLGLPKQERWMYEHRDRLTVPVSVGVGAAFKFESGAVLRAPSWIGDLGFEWMWRLAQEPRRIWRRVFVDGPCFIGHMLLEISKLRKYQ